MRVISIGECMAELSPAEVADTYRRGFAGDTFNTAWYLAQLAPDLDVAYCTRIGDDDLSAQLREFIRASRIDDSLVKTHTGGTLGLYLVSLANGERSFTYWRGQSAARHLADDIFELTPRLIKADIIYFSGITLAILTDSGRTALLGAISKAREGGATIAFDPNLRPALWTNTKQMTGWIARAANLCDIALPSHEDEARWFGDASPEVTRARYKKAGATKIIVKNGGDPIVWQDGSEIGTTLVEEIQAPVDTTAAGDSLNAGVLACLACGGTLGEGIEMGVRLARHVVQHRGALVALPWGEAQK